MHYTKHMHTDHTGDKTQQMKELLQTQNHTDYSTHIAEFKTEQ